MKRIIQLTAIISILVTACVTTQKISLQPDTLKGNWEMAKWQDFNDLSQIFPSGVPTLTFSDSTVAGYNGCNRMQGSYIVNRYNSRLQIIRMVSTKMFCRGVAEAEFVNALSRVNTYRISEPFLYLLNSNTQIAVFQRTSPIGQ
ncbi:META domain-containing protein [Geofilum sp. OHC36d9]|uniref:META domain-containing protein n=1 Tax=Geofilum sp. OHC36d9 TaxID=3458413 RepID=UPI0040338189